MPEDIGVLVWIAGLAEPAYIPQRDRDMAIRTVHFLNREVPRVRQLAASTNPDERATAIMSIWVPECAIDPLSESEDGTIMGGPDALPVGGFPVLEIRGWLIEEDGEEED